MIDPRALLKDLFDRAVAAAHPETCLASRLPPPPQTGRLVLLAAGKAAGAMVETAEQFYLDGCGFSPDRLVGHAATRPGYARPTRRVDLVEAGHPTPDRNSQAAAEAALRLAGSAGPDDRVFVLLSGGASANWVAPAGGLALDQKQAIHRALVRSAAPIGEINTVRKHLSRIKGGRLALAARPARLRTLAISDVPGDDPAVIGSGPTVADPTTLAEAKAVCDKHGIALPPAALALLADPANETPKPGTPGLDPETFEIVARPRDAMDAAAKRARAAGLDVVDLGPDLQGEARDVASAHARLARDIAAAGRPALILSGGELTVTLRGDGKGGPNQEYALALALALGGDPRVAALAADTDGTDGGSGSASDPAGAIVGPWTLARAAGLGLDAASFLARNDSSPFFAALGDLVAPGPTCTNVNDFRAILVWPSALPADARALPGADRR